MAWTLSARDGDAFARASRWFAVEARLLDLMTSIGQGDPAHGIYASSIIIFALAGTAAFEQHISTLACILIFNATALALWSKPRPAAVPLTKVDAAPHRSSPERAVFSELIAKPDKREFSECSRLDALTTHMSHELRTPLNAVIGFSELMTQQAFGPLGSSCYDTYARGIHESGMQLLKTAEDALAITAILTARKIPAAARLCNLGALVEDAVTFCYAARDPSALMPNLDCSGDLDIGADAQCVRQMLINIISDAKARAQPGTSFTITTSSDGEEIELTLALSAAKPAPISTPPVFALTMAATLAELVGAKFSCGTAETGVSQTRVAFPRAAQADLFH